MITYRIENFVNGWIIGDFIPSIQRSKNFEIAIKTYSRGAKETSHYHKIATEITVIAKGKVKMCKNIFSTGDIILLMPGEKTDFEALEETITVVVKCPSARNDKYI